MALRVPPHWKAHVRNTWLRPSSSAKKSIIEPGSSCADLSIGASTGTLRLHWQPSLTRVKWSTCCALVAAVEAKCEALARIGPVRTPTAASRSAPAVRKVQVASGASPCGEQHRIIDGNCRSDHRRIHEQSPAQQTTARPSYAPLTCRPSKPLHCGVVAVRARWQAICLDGKLRSQEASLGTRRFPCGRPVYAPFDVTSLFERADACGDRIRVRMALTDFPPPDCDRLAWLDTGPHRFCRAVLSHRRRRPIRRRRSLL